NGSIALNNSPGNLQSSAIRTTGTVKLQATGDITEGSLSRVIANGGLVVSSSAGNVVLDGVNNNTSTIAGGTSGAGKAFTYRDADALTVGSVTFGTTTVNGVTTNSGAVSVTSGAGANDLTVNQAISTGGGSVSLSSGRDIALAASVNAGGGTATLTAGRNIGQTVGMLTAGTLTGSAGGTL